MKRIKREITDFMNLSQLPLRAIMKENLVMVGTSTDCPHQYHMNIFQEGNFISFQLFGYIQGKRMQLKLVAIPTFDYASVQKEIAIQLASMIMSTNPNWHIEAKYTG